MINLRWQIARKLLAPNWFPISRSTFQRLVGIDKSIEPILSYDPDGWTYDRTKPSAERFQRGKVKHALSHQARQGGKSSAMTEVILEGVKDGRVFYSYDPNLIPVRGGPAAAAFMPVEQHISVASEDDLTRMELNRIRTDLLKWAQQYDNWAWSNQKQADRSKEPYRHTYHDMAMEMRAVARLLRQIARGRQ